MKRTKRRFDEGKIIYYMSVNSLDDKQLTNAWGKVKNSVGAYKKFLSSIAEMFKREQFIAFREKQKEYKEEELKLENLYYSSATEFFKRINELRSQ